jgi:hypothetical protein
MNMAGSCNAISDPYTSPGCKRLNYVSRRIVYLVCTMRSNTRSRCRVFQNLLKSRCERGIYQSIRYLNPSFVCPTSPTPHQLVYASILRDPRRVFLMVIDDKILLFQTVWYLPERSSGIAHVPLKLAKSMDQRHLNVSITLISTVKRCGPHTGQSTDPEEQC